MRLRNAGQLAATATMLMVAPPLAQAAAVQAPAVQQTTPSLAQRAQEKAQRLADQRRPRTAVPFDPKQFDKYVGIYKLDRYQFIAITREGEHFFAAQVGRPDQKFELCPESPTAFFAKAAPIQIGFAPDAQGAVTGFLIHTGGFEVSAPKTSEAVATAALVELAERIKNKTPSPGAEQALRRFIAAFRHGQPDYDEMIPLEQVQIYERAPAYTAHFQKWGALRSLTFVDVTPNGFDRYLAVYDHGRAEMTVEPLAPDGKTAGIRIGKVEDQ